MYDLLLSFIVGFLFGVLCFFFFKQKTAYEMRISDWSSDVCSSDLQTVEGRERYPIVLRYPRTERDSLAALKALPIVAANGAQLTLAQEIGRASCRERVCQYV